MTYYSPKYFRLEELLPKAVFTSMGVGGLILMDARILYTLDLMREHFGFPITANNWNRGGYFDQRGFRNDQNTGTPYSQHRYGRAIDCDVLGHTADEVRAELIAHKDKFEYITVLETGISWVHLDCRDIERKSGEIVLVKP